MDNLESGLQSILSNPQMMEQIMSIAQNFQSEPAPPPPQAEGLPELDFATIQKITSLIGKTSIDSQQRALLQALRPYLSGQRIG